MMRRWDDEIIWWFENWRWYDN